MKIFNSLSKSIEEFEPISDKKVGMYTCGPTVYDYVTIGNWRTYTLGDFLNRAFRYLGYEVDYVMNITDVGHLTGDNEGDADTGEDRLEKASNNMLYFKCKHCKKSSVSYLSFSRDSFNTLGFANNKITCSFCGILNNVSKSNLFYLDKTIQKRVSAWDIADKYTNDFLVNFDKLNLLHPKVWSKATEHIKEQIELIKKIEEAGFAYKIDDGIYFDVDAYEKKGNKYGELSTLDQIREGARVEVNEQKRDARDFALWKFSPNGVKRDMEWESPWGMGFPGWHIECSAMGMKYLGEQFDLHVGGEDLRSTHHPNEIAQSEAGTGKKPFVKYWVHGAFLLVDGGRMGKSLGNAYTITDLVNKGYEAMDLRYFYLTGHYRKQINFTFEALDAAREARNRLVRQLRDYGAGSSRVDLKESKLEKIDEYRRRFDEAISEDLNMPQALGVVWEVMKSNIADYDKYDLVFSFDEVLGLNLREDIKKTTEIPEEVEKLRLEHEQARAIKDYARADEIKEQIEQLGYGTMSGNEGTSVYKK